MTAPPCHLCGAPTLSIVEGFDDLPRVSSDCRPWVRGGRLAFCTTCGGVVKPVSPMWREERRQIYTDYAVYPQSGGVEQAVFALHGQAVGARSEALIQRVSALRLLGDKGRMADIGCGAGSFLNAFHRHFPHWRLTGIELDDRNAETVRALPAVEAFCSGGVETLAGRFDVVSLIHVLEHLESPEHILTEVGRRLTDGGHLIIQTPYYGDNPFDLVIVDHTSHFSPATLWDVASRAGFSVSALSTDWVSKEISMVCGKTGRALPRPRPGPHPGQAATWLRAVADEARRQSARVPFGIFGASIAASWLTGAVAADTPFFFVDENPATQGRIHLGRPILAPQDVPEGATVYIALPHPIAKAIAARQNRDDIAWIVPPPLEDGAFAP